MSKRVHFAATNRVYSPIPTTPSPCASTSSLPSSPDIPTPPPELEFESSSLYPRSPYPLPFELYLNDVVESKDMQIHLYLAYTPFSEPLVPHDLSLPLPVVKEQYPPLALTEPATQPPLEQLTIICPDYLKWEVPVKASYPGSYVSVDDVLNSIYQELRLPINHMEYSLLGAAKQAVDAAYFSRLNRIADSAIRDQEAAKGVKRVDFLMCRNRFMGLSGTHRGRDIWELNVS